MTLEAMKQVVAAEADAKASYQEAAKASKEMIAEAETKGKAYQAERRADSAVEVKKMLLDAEAEAAKNGEEIMHHAENQCAVIRAHAESRMDAAAERIVERIVID